MPPASLTPGPAISSPTAPPLPSLLAASVNAFRGTTSFYRILAYFLLGGAYDNAKNLAGPFVPKAIASDTRARVQLYSLALIFKLWSKPHYRNPSFQVDLLRNLRNVAVPGTGIPLSLFCHTKITALLYILFAMPTVCFWGALNTARATRKEQGISLLSPKFLASALSIYVEYLLHPPDWFSFWQLNCRLATFHSFKTKSPGYAYEDKWTFLKKGDELGIPVSPFLKMPQLVIKDTNEEGGMGIYFYKNAIHGGQWIIQERLENSEELEKLLPPDAPLSTVRVITASDWSLEHPWDLPGLVFGQGLSIGFNSPESHPPLPTAPPTPPRPPNTSAPSPPSSAQAAKAPTQTTPPSSLTLTNPPAPSSRAPPTRIGTTWDRKVGENRGGRFRII